MDQIVSENVCIGRILNKLGGRGEYDHFLFFFQVAKATRLHKQLTSDDVGTAVAP